MNKFKFTLNRVIDGDTLEGVLHLGFNIDLKSRIRLANIDVVELRQQGGYEAKQFVQEALEGSTLYVITEGKFDSFGRVIGDISYNHIFSLSEALKFAGFEKVKGD